MSLTNLLPLLVALFLLTTLVKAQANGAPAITDGFEWPMAMSLYGGDTDSEDIDGEETEFDQGQRRSLFWHKTKYYISYGALAANRIPCPPRSGRSYYTNNCFSAHGPAHPYTRGCSRITRCRR
ncbi:hypothetical protein ACFE04_001843 [Oxalis oulophora]